MASHNFTGKNGYVYILANHNKNVLYVGMTCDLLERIWKHRTGEGCDFTKKYNVKYLMYFEKNPNINDAIEREKQLKNWHHDWKLNLVKSKNPILKDLWDELV